ncbi:hypothetical protein WDD9_006251 [Paenibacillus melissococcoides]|uniref:hypothetical protein n=1 Tax=Paenibacillus melissococcoides TaxID=2912268 RepID=UPI0021C2D197|nr:hypothetical protein [Paenibacillus melissococcoides]CAH8721361.1 hypothetical protein WDD9_006251 [Paenibacillus melissococcoides]
MSNKHYPIILSDSSTRQKDSSTDIKTELEDNPAIIEDFGASRVESGKAAVLVTSTDIRLRPLAAARRFGAAVIATGVLTLIVWTTSRMTKMFTRRSNARNWKAGSTRRLVKAGDTYTDIVYIGTIPALRFSAFQGVEEP